MEDIIKLTRIKRDKNYDMTEFDIYINPRYIINFRKDDKTEHTRIDLYFPDTVRAYVVKETPEEVKHLINNEIFINCDFGGDMNNEL